MHGSRGCGRPITIFSLVTAVTRTVLVTGGCGFIGSHFVRHLLTAHQDWRIVNLDKLTYAGNLANLADIQDDVRYRFVRGDIVNAELVERLFEEVKPWAVVNFAAESHVDRSILDPTPFLQTNVAGVQVLLATSARHGVERFLQISTDEVYGDADGMAPFAEDAALRPSSPYAASKAAADLMCIAGRRTYGVPALIARSSNNYGPYQFPEKLIPLMIRNALAGGQLPVYGDGAQIRDWLYVSDNCEAIARVLEQGRVGEIYNIATGKHRTNLEVIRTTCHLLAAETGQDAEAFLDRVQSVPDRPGHDRRYAVDPGKIRRELAWQPRVQFEDGLRTTVRWYLASRDWIRHVTSGEYEAYYDTVYRKAWGRTATG